MDGDPGAAAARGGGEAAEGALAATLLCCPYQQILQVGEYQSRFDLGFSRCLTGLLQLGRNFGARAAAQKRLRLLGSVEAPAGHPCAATQPELSTGPAHQGALGDCRRVFLLQCLF